MQLVSKCSLMGAIVGDLNSSHGTVGQDPIENHNADSLGFLEQQDHAFCIRELNTIQKTVPGMPWGPGNEWWQWGHMTIQLEMPIMNWIWHMPQIIRLDSSIRWVHNSTTRLKHNRVVEHKWASVLASVPDPHVPTVAPSSLLRPHQWSLDGVPYNQLVEKRKKKPSLIYKWITSV